MYIEKLHDIMEKGVNVFESYNITESVLTKLTKNCIKQYNEADEFTRTFYETMYPKVMDYLKDATIVLAELQEIPVSNPEYN